FSPLDAITEVPVLRPNGTVVSEPGYDKATKLLYQPGFNLSVPPIPDKPSRKAIRAALQLLLNEVLVDFPFDGQESRANTLGLLLPPIVRPAITGPVPLALLDKPKRGTGASLLAELISLIVTGRPAEMGGAPTDGEEWRKAITARLCRG